LPYQDHNYAELQGLDGLALLAIAPQREIKNHWSGENCDILN
jgi:hypothetical protein